MNAVSPRSSQDQEVQWQSKAILLIRIACFLLFVGRAWQHLIWDAPFRALLWDESIMKSVVETLTTLSWYEYVTSPTVDILIQSTIRAFGVFYLICAICCLRVKNGRRLEKATLYLGSVSLLFLSFLLCKEKFYQLAEFFEYSIQFSAPALLAYVVSKPPGENSLHIKRAFTWIKVVIALTFISHGLYAFGYYPVPGNFLDMTMTILRIENEGALLFLKTAGLVDFAIGFVLFASLGTSFSIFKRQDSFVSRTFSSALTVVCLWAFIWGTLTALARVVSGVSVETLFTDLNQWSLEALVRMPHGILPLAAFYLVLQSQPSTEVVEHEKVLHVPA